MFKKQILPVCILFFLVLFSACGEVDPVEAAGDTTPPVVTITSPADEAIVSGDFIITAEASDAESAISVLNFYVNGVKVDTVYATNIAAGTQDFASSTILLDSLQAGANVIKVVAMNGKLMTSEAVVTVTKGGAPVDSTAPLLSVLAPTSGQAISNDFIIMVDTSDDESGIASVSFSIDGVSYGAVAGQAGVATYQSSLVEIAGLSAGAHTITVVSVNGVSLETIKTINVTVAHPTINDTIMTTLVTAEPPLPAEAVALDVLEPYFSWLNGEVTGVLSYRVSVWDAAENNVFYWVENVPSATSVLKYGDVPAGSGLEVGPVNLQPGTDYVLNITALDVADSAGSGVENEIGFSRVRFTVSGTRAPSRRAVAARTLSRAAYLQRLQAIRTGK